MIDENLPLFGGLQHLLYNFPMVIQIKIVIQKKNTKTAPKYSKLTEQSKRLINIDIHFKRETIAGPEIELFHALKLTAKFNHLTLHSKNVYVQAVRKSTVR